MPAPRLRHRTGTPASSRSTGAGRISTVTVALVGDSQPHRRVGDADGHRRRGRARGCRRRDRLGHRLGELPHAALRPDDLDRRRLGGDGARRRSRAPARPRRPASTGTTRVADGSSSSATVDGTTCTTSTPNGARTSSVRRWNSRDPGRAARRSRTATTSPGSRRLEHRRRSAHPHVDGGRRVADDLELRRHVAELERHAQAALDDLLAGHGQPQQRRQRDRQHLQAEVAERVIRHQPTS